MYLRVSQWRQMSNPIKSVCGFHCTGKVYAALRTATPPVSCSSLLITASKFMQGKKQFSALLDCAVGQLPCIVASTVQVWLCPPCSSFCTQETSKWYLAHFICQISFLFEHTNRPISPETLPLGHNDISGSVGSETFKQAVTSLPCFLFCCRIFTPNAIIYTAGWKVLIFF